MTKRDKAIEIYMASLDTKESLGKEWRKSVLQKITDELGCTWNASVSHFNFARIKNGGEVKKRVEGAKKVPAAKKAAKATVSDTDVAVAEKPAIEKEVWCVEGADNTTYYLGEDAAREAAKKIRGAVVKRCPELDE